MSNLNKMTFLSYQPFFKHEGVEINEDEFNVGEYRTKAIMERDNHFIERLGYNPYWAIGGKDTSDLILSSMFCSPNSAEIAYIFQTDDYIRINKVKQENYAAGFITDQMSLDFVDDTQPDIATEFLVKETTGSSLIFAFSIPSLMKVADGGHVIDGFVVGREYFTILSKSVQELWDSCVLDCYEYLRNNYHYDRKFLIENNINPEYVDTYIELHNARSVFEMVVLPVILEWISPENSKIKNGQKTIKVKSVWFLRCAYTCKSLIDTVNRFGDAIYAGEFTDEVFAKLVNEGKRMILDDDILGKLLNIDKCYPNDTCPCGSGLKFKKCHGRIIGTRQWGKKYIFD